MGRVTLKNVAELAGVTPATVSYVLSGKRTISEETKARVMDAIEKLDYVPDLNARSLSMRDSKLIGVVVPQTEPGDRLMFQNGFFCVGNTSTLASIINSSSMLLIALSSFRGSFINRSPP